MTSQQADHFEVLGLPRRYHLASSDIEARYHERAWAHHPDRHMKEGGAARLDAALRTAALTEAYRTLRDRGRRAEHLLELEGVRLGDRRVASSFLAEVMELREALEEGDAAGRSRVEAEVHARAAATEAELDEQLARYDAGERGSGLLDGIADRLVALRYLRRFTDELEARREENR